MDPHRPIITTSVTAPPTRSASTPTMSGKSQPGLPIGTPLRREVCLADRGEGLRHPLVGLRRRAARRPRPGSGERIGHLAERGDLRAP